MELTEEEENVVGQSGEVKMHSSGKRTRIRDRTWKQLFGRGNAAKIDNSVYNNNINNNNYNINTNNNIIIVTATTVIIITIIIIII